MTCAASRSTSPRRSSNASYSSSPRAAELRQDWLDESFLGLRLVRSCEARALSIPKLGQVVQQRPRVRSSELWPCRQALAQEVIGEELTVVIRAERERELVARRPGHGASDRKQWLLLDLLLPVDRRLTRWLPRHAAVVRDNQALRVEKRGSCTTKRSHARVGMQLSDYPRELYPPPGLVGWHLDVERCDGTRIGVEISRLDDQHPLSSSGHEDHPTSIPGRFLLGAATAAVCRAPRDPCRADAHECLEAVRRRLRNLDATGLLRWRSTEKTRARSSRLTAGIRNALGTPGRSVPASSAPRRGPGCLALTPAPTPPTPKRLPTTRDERCVRIAQLRRHQHAALGRQHAALELVAGVV